MLELPIWQLAAGVLAVTLMLVAAVAFLRYPRPVMLVVFGLLVLIPTIGFAAYALVPGPVPHPGPLLWLAFIPAIGGLAAGIWMLGWMSSRRSALTFSNIEFLSNGTLVAYGGLVLGLSDVLALWQPVYAVANVAVSAAWALAWVPTRWRESRVESTVDIRAPVSRVYSFLADPANWPRYQEARPAGPLAVGKEVVTRQRYDSHIRGPKMLPEVIETTSVVTELASDSRIAMQIANRAHSTSTIEFTATNGDTRLMVRARSLAPYRLAVFGALIELRTQAPERRARGQRSLARLKQLLESPPPQAR
jgi:uncharacterized protein YndB with AHSA1/START domain